MPLLLLIIFIAVPVAEIALLIKVGVIIGPAATIALVILTAIIGTSLLRWQGLSVLARAQTALDGGQLPMDSVIDGVFLVIAGAFLLTPGLMTDAIGFLLFIPTFRRTIARYAFARLKASKKVQVDIFATEETHGGPKPGFHTGDGSGPIIDGEIVGEDLNEGPGPDKGNAGSRKGSSPWRK